MSSRVDSNRFSQPLWEGLTSPSSWGNPTLRAVGAEGVRIRFADGNSRLCGTSGLWNVPLGYGNAEIADAVSAALRSASYLSLFRSSHAYAFEAAEALLTFTGGRFARVLFSTSGSAANDMTMKLVRQAAALSGSSRRIIVGLQGSYHGLTYGSLSLSGDALGQPTYGADRRAVRHISARDGGNQLRQLFEREGEQIAALVLEPVLGSGAFVLEDDFLSTVAEVRGHYDFALVADEVATGFGRTGTLFASERWPVQPDILVLSKALTNGSAAAAAVLVSETICEIFDRNDGVFVHGETQAGTPASCAAILATLAEFERMDAVRLANELDKALARTIERISVHPTIVDTRGIGCFRSLVLSREGQPLSAVEVASVVTSIRKVGAIVQPGPSCIQLVPAFVYDTACLDELETAVLHGLDDAIGNAA